MRESRCELVNLRAGRKVELVIFRDEGPPTIHPCGCMLREAERHYCLSRGPQPVIALPERLCPHVHWSMLEDRCLQCGVAGETLCERALVTLSEYAAVLGSP